MIIQKILLLIVPLLVLVEAQTNSQSDRTISNGGSFRRPIIRTGSRPIVPEPDTKATKEFGYTTKENIPFAPVTYSYVDFTKPPEVEKPKLSSNSEYYSTTSSTIPDISTGNGVPTRKPLWSKRTSTSYFNRLSAGTPGILPNTSTLKPQFSPITTTEAEYTTFQPKTIEPYTIKAVSKEPPTYESKTAGPSKEAITIITPTPQVETDDTSNLRRSMKTEELALSVNPNELYQFEYNCGNINGYYSVVNQCEEYIECKNNNAYRNICPAGLHFDSTKKWPIFPCAYPFEVICHRQSITPGTPGILSNTSTLAPQFSPITTTEAEYTTFQPKTIEPYTIKAVSKEPPTYESKTAGPSKEAITIITPTPQIETDDTSNLRRSINNTDVVSVGPVTSEFPTPYTQSEFDNKGSSTQSDIVINESETEELALSVNPNEFYQFEYNCGNINGYYSVVNQCEEYIECKNNNAYRNICPAGLHFDSTKKWPIFPCAYPFEVICHRQSITPVVKNNTEFDFRLRNRELTPRPIILDGFKPSAKKPLDNPVSTTESEIVTKDNVPISSTYVTSKIPEIYEETVIKSLGSEIVQPVYLTISTTEKSFISPISRQPNRDRNWPQRPPTPSFGRVTTDTPRTTTYAIFQRKDPIVSETLNKQAEVNVPEVSTTTDQIVVSNETPADASAISTSPQVMPDTSINEQTTPANTEPIINNQSPNWILPARPSYNDLVTTSTTTTTMKPITTTQYYNNLTTRPTTPQGITTSYNGYYLHDYTCSKLNGFYSITNQCDEYVECRNKKAHRKICPDGLHFDPAAQWPAFPCAYPSEVKCHSQSIIQQAQPTGDCPHRYGIFPAPNGDCGHFIMCQEGAATLMSCPAGLAFNSITEVCDWPVNVPECNLGVFQDFICPSEHYAQVSHSISYYKYQNSCKQYIACQEGRPRLLKCDPGLSFDEKTQQCLNTDLVENCQDYINE